MTRTSIVLAFILALSTAATAATLTVVPDKQTYNVGETITLTVSGDAQGAESYGIFGRLRYDPALTQTTGAAQQKVGNAWTLGTLSTGDGFADAFNQISFPAASSGDFLAVGGSAFAAVTLLAEAPGMVNVTWETQAQGFQLDFFGLTTAPGTSFTIIQASCQTSADCDDNNGCTQDECLNDGTCSNVAPDSDGDGTPDCTDGCVDDPAKTAPGTCGCGVSDADSDGNGTPDCFECDGTGTDSDGDGEQDATDECPETPAGEAVDQAGCSLAEFCAGLQGWAYCNNGDWRNDEPLGNALDCRMRGASCVPR